MSFEEDDSKQKNIQIFLYSFPGLKTYEVFQLEIPIEIPFLGSLDELAKRIILNFKIPCYEEPGLFAALKEFVESKTIRYQDEIASDVIQRAKKSEIDIDDIVKKLEKLYKDETVEYSEKKGTSDDELFSNVYHKFIHSGQALQTMLQVEQSYSVAVSQLMAQRDEHISSLTANQSEEMNSALENVHDPKSEDEINGMVTKHFEDQYLHQGRWNSEIDTLKDSQRREYRNWVMQMYEDQQNLAHPALISTDVPRTFPENLKKEVAQSPMMEESFTIHLGSQMKQMHNIRIMSVDLMSFYRSNTNGGLDDISAQRLQTALGLYSNDLCGLVLLSDSNDLHGFSGISKEFCSTCESSTDFHFPSVTDQLDSLKDQIKEAVTWRKAGQHSGNLTLSEQKNRQTSSKHLQTGDIFITKHSNLASVHVVFHLIVDDTLRSNEINSRHAAILGLRNILKIACSNDITTLTIPVLLMHEMTEEMTVAWCNKRAELVLKCVKGFMIEMASWGGSDLKNLQFLVPEGISEDVFGSLANMIPNIFRVSNPLVLKTSSSPSTPKTA